MSFSYRQSLSITYKYAKINNRFGYTDRLFDIVRGLELPTIEKLHSLAQMLLTTYSICTLTNMSKEKFKLFVKMFRCIHGSHLGDLSYRFCLHDINGGLAEVYLDWG
uniref:Uncharacterized protein n=1 Tax=viral metagenome TaxID=1070528 RepID=A0A6C0IWD4_9ZZZZ